MEHLLEKLRLGQKKAGKTIQLLNLPVHTTADVLKECLERQTGEGTVLAVKIRPTRSGRRLAIVQFTASRYAEDICSMRLLFNSQPLTSRYADRDIIPKPKTFEGTVDNATLHFGCQLSHTECLVLWKGQDVKVQFGHGLKKLEFFLSSGGIQYKLELFRGSIWQIRLLCPRGQESKILLIQLQAAPRIYMKDVPNSGHIYEDPLLNYFRDIPNEHWIRAVDFTLSSFIGQSSVLCLEVQSGCKLPDIGRSFYYYKKCDGEFRLKHGSPYSCSFNLVPIVRPPIELPYSTIFKVNSLVQNGILVGPTLDPEFYNLVDPRVTPQSYIDNALESLFQSKDSCFEPVKYLREKYKIYQCSKQPPKQFTYRMDSGLAHVHRVQVTPTKVYFCGPEVNVSNRVLRNYPEDTDNFLRVSFIDEDGEKMRSMDLVPRSVAADGEKHTDVYERVLSILKDGIEIGNKKFEFLAFSSSQLRENSAWMFASRSGLSAADIRNWMGDFREIRNVAKYAARLGQSFSSSRESLSVAWNEVETIPDVEIEFMDSQAKSRKYTFSDGIGKISAGFARKVASKCCSMSCMPSAFQIRYAGYKGVVAVDPQSKFKLSLRKSMYKYKSENRKLDVLKWSKYQPCFLNRQVITLLSTLGVQDEVFLRKQKEAIDQLDAILTDSMKAQEALQVMPPGENTDVLKEILMCGYMPHSEPFLTMMLQHFRAFKLLELRTKSRVFIPKGRLLIGCLDETRTLDYGQVFVKASSVAKGDLFEFGGNCSEKGTFVVKGKVVVAKNPCLHPGDIRVLTAVDVPALHHMVDCVVFPQKGRRPHADECSGSDLDGDDYFVSWDSEFIPPRQVSPMDYDGVPPAVLDHDVTIEEVEEYFANYMVNDSLGVISNAHIVFADKELQKAESQACVELSKLASTAVDFPKTGIPAKMPLHLQVKEYPDFMEKLDKPTYESNGVIGKLYRAVKDISSDVDSYTLEKARRCYDRDMEVDGFERHLTDASYYKSTYDFRLGCLMRHYGLRTEAEVMSGNSLKVSGPLVKNKDTDAVRHAVKSLKKVAKGWFDEMGKRAGSPASQDVFAKASAWYHVTYHPDYWGTYSEGTNRAHFLSFAWIVYDKLVQIKKQNSRKGKSPNWDGSGIDSLTQNFGIHLRME